MCELILLLLNSTSALLHYKCTHKQHTTQNVGERLIQKLPSMNKAFCQIESREREREREKPLCEKTNSPLLVCSDQIAGNNEIDNV